MGMADGDCWVGVDGSTIRNLGRLAWAGKGALGWSDLAGLDWASLG